MSGRRPQPLRLLIGAALTIAAACLISWMAFSIARGPAECGGDAPACPEGFVGALLGGVAAIFVLAPVGIGLLATRLRGGAAAGLALCFGAVAAGVHVSRFEAAPVTDATLGVRIMTVVFGLLALVALLGAIAQVCFGTGRPAPDPGDA
ncbi:hypothetical protein [Patulibacter defluvii]|uniref:hypothetical protein n=1 Tax=Patulibacter defluvii TaxID=3095358 RepID=UPI002A749A4A|nr:hypothetical protein [Patulibacter sp. DM4]